MILNWMQEAIIMSSQTTTDTSIAATTTSKGLFYSRKIDTGTELSMKGESV